MLSLAQLSPSLSIVTLKTDDNADKVVQCVTDTFSERDGVEEP